LVSPAARAYTAPKPGGWKFFLGVGYFGPKR
jgi:hypothetical protein